MRLLQKLQLFALAVAITGFAPLKPTQAITFSEQEVNQNQFVVVAAPYRHGYNLLIIEQIPGKRQCWSENGANPVKVDPLLLNFDFTDACKRSTDSNSYSIRLDNKDYGMDYLLSVVERDGELHLIGTHRNSDQPEIHLGKTHGMDSGSLKIFLDPGWRLTKRTYQGDTTEHIYLSGSSTAMEQPKGCNVVGSAN